jgi:hypothetical protein
MEEHGPFGKNEKEEQVRQEFRDLGRKSLLSRDPVTGLPRELQTGPIDPEGLRGDLLQRAKEVAEAHNSQEENDG